MRLILVILIFASMPSIAQQTLPLYPGAIPNSKPSTDEEKIEFRDGITIISKISKPTLAVYLPAEGTATGTAVIIFPGGGYGVNAYSHEGTDVALEFNKRGVAAFVVKYRIPDDATMVNREIGPLQDAQYAILTVRKRAAELGIRPDRIGIMGFSAGGHLASTAGTHFDRPVIDNPEKISLRPDFMILVYPVISFRDEIGHTGSRDNLIGKNPSKEKIHYYSNELQVNAQTPPTFLVHAGDDGAVNPENSIQFYQQLLKHKVPAELHLFERGGHGFGMFNKTNDQKWMEWVGSWMKARGV